LGPVVEGDVRALDAIAAVAGERVDVLWSSFPCQAWSTAGARRGAADERNGWPWTVDALDRFRPAWFLGENVRGLLLHRSGCTAAGGQRGLFGTAPAEDCPGCYFERVILPDLRARFACVGWWLLDAADYGVPQHRRRVILWAGPRPLEAPTPTYGPGRALPWVSMREALGLGAGHVPMTTKNWELGRDPLPVEGPSPTIRTTIGRPRPWTLSATVFLEVAGSHHNAEAFCFATQPEGAERVADRRVRRLSDGPCPTIGAEYTGTLAGHPWIDRPSPTVSAVGEQRGSGPGGNPEKMQRASDALYLGTGRRLTVAECAVLQDFPAGHPWQGGVGAQYRQVGNAVPPRLAEVVGRALMTAIEDVRGLS
jgi:DNA (cytosine-5)-methyltransferase 1